MQTSQYNYKNIRKFPVFDPVDSTPISEENEPYRLKLCFCPLCQKGMIVLARERSRNVISWQYICKVVFYCLSQIHKKEGYFSLKYDVHWFIVDHWYLFSQLEQFRTNPNKWKKAILDAMIHCNAFESGKSTVNKAGVWKLKNYEAPWEYDEQNCYDHNYNACNTVVFVNCNANPMNYTNMTNMSSYTPMNNYTNYMSTECSQDDSIRNNIGNNVQQQVDTYLYDFNALYLMNMANMTNMQNLATVQNMQNGINGIQMNNVEYPQNYQQTEDEKKTLPSFDTVFKVTIKEDNEENETEMNNFDESGFIQTGIY